MKTKDEIIKLYYYPDFEGLKDQIDMQTGFCMAKDRLSHKFSGAKVLFIGEYPWMPISLARVIDNNGWKDIKEWDPKTGECYELYLNDGTRMVYETHLDTIIEAIKEYAILFKKLNLSPNPNFIP